MRNYFDGHARVSKPDAKELAKRNRESGLTRAIQVHHEPLDKENIPDGVAWLHFDGSVPVINALKDGVLTSVALSDVGTPPSSSALVFRSSTTGTANAASNNVPQPPGVASDDVMLAFFVIAGASAPITTPSGWTLITRIDNSSTVSLVSYWSTPNASPSYIWSGLSGPSAGTILAYSGANTTPIDTYSSASGSGTTTAPSSPAVTTSADNCIVIRAYAVEIAANGVSVSVAPPTGYTNRGQAAFSSSSYHGYTVEASDVLQATAGSSASATATASGTVSYASQTIAIRPA